MLFEKSPQFLRKPLRVLVSSVMADKRIELECTFTVISRP